jgi:hypothetical protein
MNTPVLLLIFNRPDTTAQVFEAIRKARPPRLYVAADGPRVDRHGEAQKVAKVREIATAVDWPCEVKTLFRDENLGCKYAVSGGITWFFEHEEEGIILEDDCLPNSDFFTYCEILLNRYATNERVWVINGNNFQNGVCRGEASYYFSHYNHVWGWATWRRAWQKADMDILFWPNWKTSSSWKRFWTDATARKYWTKIFNSVYDKKIETTWDYPWTATIWYYGGLTATPNVNLVSNIGFGPDSTHTCEINSPNSALKTAQIGNIKHPTSIILDQEADRYTFDNHFYGNDMRFPRNVIRFPSRVAKYLNRHVQRIRSSLS